MLARRTRLVVALLAATACLGTAGVAFGLPPFNKAPKSTPVSSGQAELYALTTACRGTFDRLVIRARLATPGYRVRYVRRIVQDGSGLPVRLLGTKRIEVVLRMARGHTEAGRMLLPDVRTPRCPNLRQIKLAGDFEGVVTLGLGLRRRTGFRVFRLTAPRRTVIDILH